MKICNPCGHIKSYHVLHEGKIRCGQCIAENKEAYHSFILRVHKHCHEIEIRQEERARLKAEIEKKASFEIKDGQKLISKLFVISDWEIARMFDGDEKA